MCKAGEFDKFFGACSWQCEVTKVMHGVHCTVWGGFGKTTATINSFCVVMADNFKTGLCDKYLNVRTKHQSYRAVLFVHINNRKNVHTVEIKNIPIPFYRLTVPFTIFLLSRTSVSAFVSAFLRVIHHSRLCSTGKDVSYLISSGTVALREITTSLMESVHGCGRESWIYAIVHGY